MRPAFSVILLTTLIGAGQGLFLALYSGELYSVVNLLPAQHGARFYALGSALALALLLAGLVASFFHLGHPERAWRAASQWRTSWLSREVIALPAFAFVVLLYGLLHLWQGQPVLLMLGGGVALTPTLLIGALGSLLSLALFVCTAMIYAGLRFLREWHSPLTVANFILFGGASGYSLAAGFALLQGSGLIGFYGVTAIVLTLLGLIGRHASLARNRRLAPKSTLQSAIGIRHTQIAQKAQGAMGGSFNTREYFHGRSEATVRLIERGFLLLAFLAPIVLLGLGLAGLPATLLLLAFPVQYLGLVAERWHFFAQARHPQNLYYQSVS